MREVEIKRFATLADSDEADREYYRGLSGEERLDIVLDLVQRHREGQDEAAEGFARVYRIVELGAD